MTVGASEALIEFENAAVSLDSFLFLQITDELDDDRKLEKLSWPRIRSRLMISI